MNQKSLPRLSELYAVRAEALLAKSRGQEKIGDVPVATLLVDVSEQIKAVKAANRSARNEAIGRVIGRMVNVSVSTVQTVTDVKAYGRAMAYVQARALQARAGVSGVVEEVREGLNSVKKS